MRLDALCRSTEVDASYYQSHKQHIDSFTLDMTTIDSKNKLSLEISLRDEIPTLFSYANSHDKINTHGVLFNVSHGSQDILASLSPSTKVSLKYTNIGKRVQ
jgi:hypothetical protein